jgi:hypothetical protein
MPKIDYYEDVPRMEAIRDRLAMDYLREPTDALMEQIWIIDIALRARRERAAYVPSGIREDADPEVYDEMIWELVQAGILHEKVVKTDYNVGGPGFTNEHIIKKKRRYVTDWEELP